jgi:hypothetical protein
MILANNFACSPEIINLQVNGQTTDMAIVGDLGKEITLECQVKANPPAEVRWVKDNVSVTNATASATGKSYYVHISGELERWVNLTILNSHPGDGGEYTCVGENKGKPDIYSLAVGSFYEHGKQIPSTIFIIGSLFFTSNPFHPISVRPSVCSLLRFY